jgi:hypothetical protein
MGFNFPNSPTEGAVYTAASGQQYTFSNGVWLQTGFAITPLKTAESYNRVVNGAMQHSQENGNTTGTTSGYYPADQWLLGVVGITASVTRQVNPDGTRVTVVGNSKPSLATGDFLMLYQNVEGNRIADFQWGTATAKQVVLRFEIYSDVAGTFSASVRNAATNRSFIAPFAVPAAAWTTIALPIQGDTTGTWPTDNTLGLTVAICTAAGSTFVGVNGWQAGNKLASPSATNGVATTTNFYIRNVGLYADPNNTGLAPPWVIPDYASELVACQRYWEQGMDGIDGYHATGGAGSGMINFRTIKRVAPALSGSSQIASNCSAATTYDAINTLAFRAWRTVTATGSFAFRDAWVANARM